MTTVKAMQAEVEYTQAPKMLGFVEMAHGLQKQADELKKELAEEACSSICLGQFTKAAAICNYLAKLDSISRLPRFFYQQMR